MMSEASMGSGGALMSLHRRRRCSRRRPGSNKSSHNNSQHVLAILTETRARKSTNNDDCNRVLRAFSKTSDLPCDVWRWNHDDPSNEQRIDDPSIHLASNYPDCILESDNFCVLCAGFSYRYREAFASADSNEGEGNGNGNSNDGSARNDSSKSFAETLLGYCEARTGEGTDSPSLPDEIAARLKRVSGHFSVFLVQKSTANRPLRFWTWNDPFGFLPVYVCDARNADPNGGMLVLSSHWDSLVPVAGASMSSSSPELDWDVVAEYITFGTTLGGRLDSEDCENGDFGCDRTFVRGIRNLRPGTVLSFEGGTPTAGRRLHRSVATRSYIHCYGACEELQQATQRDTNVALHKPELSVPPSGWRGRTRRSFRSSEDSTHVTIRGVIIAERKEMRHDVCNVTDMDTGTGLATLGNTSESETEASSISHADASALFPELFAAIHSCVREALDQGYVARAALTGGGDTRFLLACLLLLQQEQEQKPSLSDSVRADQTKNRETIVFQTHSKQLTDWQIACHLAKVFRLKHKRIYPMSAGRNGPQRLLSLLLPWSHEELVLSNLHDQIPSRKKQQKASERYQEDTVTFTLHGRFGTEFLGCLCFNKSPLDIRTAKEVEDFGPRATRLFRAAFRPSVIASEDDDDDDDPRPNDSDSNTNTNSNSGRIRNPMGALRDRFRQLERDRESLINRWEQESSAQQHGVPKRTLAYDVAYAFQLQLYTRACFSDIYKGLRGGSWFSIPSAQFTRSNITPFLDNRLLQCMMCCVPTDAKKEPYQLYGHLYRSEIPKVLLGVPSNNKLLCHHSGMIPRAIKRPEAKSRAYIPRCVSRRTNHGRDDRDGDGDRSLAALRDRFHPAVWNGTVAFLRDTTAAAVAMDPESVRNHPRAEVRALLDRVGGDAKDACLLMGRLQSFLLWYEKRCGAVRA